MTSSSVIRGEPDPANATLADWVAYRDHLRSLPRRDEAVRLALAVARAQISKHQAHQAAKQAGSPG